jgi:hypothetical protein
MELQTFIETTLKEITTGLHNSNNKMLENNVGRGIPDHNVMNVEFDIAVSASSENGSDVGGKITVFGIGLSLTGSQSEKINNNNLSRIKFTVPLKLNTLNQKYPVSVA